MKWFKHQSDARNSLKLRKVRRKFGADGYAIYWFCLEAIAYEVDKDNLTFELKEDAETIGFELCIQEKRVQEIMLYMIEIDLFEQSGTMLTCMKLAESIDKSMTNSPKMRAWLNSKSVMTSADRVSANGDSVSTCPELELELELEKKKHKDIRSSSDKPALDYQAIVNIYNETFPELKQVKALNDKRRRMIKKLFKFASMDLVKWQNYLNAIKNKEGCQWMLETRANGATGGNWRAKDFDYFITDGCYIKVKES